MQQKTQTRATLFLSALKQFHSQSCKTYLRPWNSKWLPFRPLPSKDDISLEVVSCCLALALKAPDQVQNITVGWDLCQQKEIGKAVHKKLVHSLAFSCGEVGRGVSRDLMNKRVLHKGNGCGLDQFWSMACRKLSHSWCKQWDQAGAFCFQLRTDRNTCFVFFFFHFILRDLELPTSWTTSITYFQHFRIQLAHQQKGLIFHWNFEAQYFEDHNGACRSSSTQNN